MTEVRGSLHVRAYTPADRQAVRTIACNTADRGASVDPYVRDRELFADVVTRYYTDCEPQSVWVAEHGGQVVGYLTGCMDTRAYRRTMLWRILPRGVFRAVARGALCSAQTWRWGVAAIRTWRLGGFQRRVPLDRFPAHLHINIAQEFRGQRIGHQLMERFLAQVCTKRVPGIHVAVRSDNLPSCRFFERLGFTALSRHLVAIPNGRSSQVHETVMYGTRL